MYDTMAQGRARECLAGCGRLERFEHVLFQSAHNNGSLQASFSGMLPINSMVCCITIIVIKRSYFLVFRHVLASPVPIPCEKNSDIKTEHHLQTHSLLINYATH
jgi:hypothetical protein